MEAADGNRSSGSRARAWRVIAARAGGIDGRACAGSGTGPLEPGQRDRRGAVALERPLSDEHLVQHDAQRIDVRRRGRGLAAGLLGAEVVDRAEGRARQRHLRLGDRPGDAEVDDLDPPVAPDEHVPGLHVAMDDPVRVRRREPAGDRGGDPRRLLRRQGPAAPEDRREVLAVDVLHDDERTRRVLAVVEDGDDVRVAQAGDALRLLAEARRRSPGRAGTPGGGA